MDPHAVAFAALRRAHDALTWSAVDLSIAVACARPDDALRADANVLAEAVEREVEVLATVLQRHQ